MKTTDELLAETLALKSQLEQQAHIIKEKDSILEKNENTIKQKDAKIQSLKALNDWYIEQLKLRAKEKFGMSSEKADPNQLSLFDLFNEAETLKQPIIVEPNIETLVKPHTRKKRKGNKFDNLPVETIEYKLTDEEKICDTCGEKLTDMTKEIRKEIVIVPAEAKIIEHVTYVYSCRNCDKNGTSGFIKKAEHPKALIPKSIVSSSMLAYIMNQKYTMALPLYRQEQEFKRLGIDLSRQNLSNWTLKGADLLKPLYEALKISLLKEELIHADETTLEVLREPGRKASCNSYAWTYRTSVYNKHAVVLYEYTETRSAEHLKAFLKKWTGTYIHCDGYAGYKKLKNKTVCGCLVHAKRKFHEALVASPNNEIAKTGEAYIRKLFAIESKADEEEIKLEERLKLRQEKSKSILDEFYEWINTVEHKTLPQSLLGKAIGYALKQREYLSNFLLDARIQLSNNLAERSIKPFVIGRGNWLFANTPNGATASTVIYSIIQTAIENELKPQNYLKYVFDQIQIGTDASILLPWSDQIPESCKVKKSQQK